MREESEEFEMTKKKRYSEEPKKNEGHILVMAKAYFSQEPCISQSVLI